MSKNELMNAMEINTAAIKDGKEQIKKLNKALEIIEAYGNEYGQLLNAIVDINNAIGFQMERIATSEAFQKKRKKQLKLIEQLEALDNE